MAKNKKLLRILALFVALAGIFLIIWVLFPIAAYELAAPKLESFLSPVPKGSEGIDYTRASNWFAGGVSKKEFLPESGIKYYTISIPILKIENATVAIGGEDLGESLIQYPGTALPGKRGNAVIFGHSILPQFYDPENYLAIFSKLPTLKKDNEIKINYDGVSYRYLVEDVFEVLPTDIQVLEQDSSDVFLTLVTCTPPGHPLKPKRLIVRARIVPLDVNSVLYSSEKVVSKE